MVINLAVAEQPEEPFDFLVADGATKTNAVDVADWDEHGRVVGCDPKVVETARRAEDRLVLNPLDDAQTMIRVYDLVTDFNVTKSP